jgi:hypothetical protein
MSVLDLWSPAIKTGHILLTILLLLVKPHICQEIVPCKGKEEDEKKEEEYCINLPALKMWETDIESFKSINEIV